MAPEREPAQSATAELRDVLLRLRSAAGDGLSVPPAAVPELLGLLRSIEVTLLTRQAQPQQRDAQVQTNESAEVWLTAAEVATRLRRTKAWVYRHAKRWSFAKRPSRKTLLISERGLDGWVRRH